MYEFEVLDMRSKQESTDATRVTMKKTEKKKKHLPKMLSCISTGLRTARAALPDLHPWPHRAHHHVAAYRYRQG